MGSPASPFSRKLKIPAARHLPRMQPVCISSRVSTSAIDREVGLDRWRLLVVTSTDGISLTLLVYFSISLMLILRCTLVNKKDASRNEMLFLKANLQHVVREIKDVCGYSKIFGLEATFRKLNDNGSLFVLTKYLFQL